MNQIFWALLLYRFVLLSRTEAISEQNPLYRGPTDCDQVLKNHYLDFSEYPAVNDTTAQLNFLEMGRTCNPDAEKEFLEEMQNTFLNGTENSSRMIRLVEIWEEWRSRPDSGSKTGKRICNPKRMLECHTSTSTCVCRSTLKLFDVKDFLNDEQIVIDTVRVTKKVPNTETTEVVEECRAKVDGICQWNVPFLGFCALPCERLDETRPAYCVGQPNGPKRCRVCTPGEELGGGDSGVNRCYQEQHQRRNDATLLMEVNDILSLVIIPVIGRLCATIFITSNKF